MTALSFDLSSRISRDRRSSWGGGVLGRVSKRSTPGNWVSTTSIIKGTYKVKWRRATHIAAAELGLVVSLSGNPASLLGRDFAEVIKTFPELRVVIEHLGGVNATMRAPYREFRQVLELAHYPNFFMKLPGFGEFCPVPIETNAIAPMADMALEAFGARRMMWGSDFPPVSSREGYQNALRVPMEYFGKLSAEERDWIFGKTAEKVWGFGG